MVIIYYSHAKNTERFVRRHLLPTLSPDELNVAFRVHSDGPRGDVTHITLPHSGSSHEVTLEEFSLPPKTDVLFVTPTYGQFNHEFHHAENFTPEPMRQVMKHFHDSRHPSDTDYQAFYAVGGNRTFGKDFGIQDFIPWWLTGRRVGTFELSGSETDAQNIVNKINEKRNK